MSDKTYGQTSERYWHGKFGDRYEHPNPWPEGGAIGPAHRASWALTPEMQAAEAQRRVRPTTLPSPYSPDTRSLHLNSICPSYVPHTNCPLPTIELRHLRRGRRGRQYQHQHQRLRLPHNPLYQRPPPLKRILRRRPKPVLGSALAEAGDSGCEYGGAEGELE